MPRLRHTRICHYPLTLKELTKYLPAEADPGKWKETILRLESTATAINLSKAEAKDIEKLFDIEKKLDGLEVRQQSRVLWVETVWPTSPLTCKMLTQRRPRSRWPVASWCWRVR
jgi:hypothetical protein